MNRAARRRQAREASASKPQFSQPHALGPRFHRRRAMRLGVKPAELQLLLALGALQSNQFRMSPRATAALRKLRKLPPAATQEST